ncbi:MAG: CoA transferase subunit A [Lachnospiraceae bacterium]|jgi:acetate CoA/acetoacetate CoA-transferase alpha subunit
MKDKMITAAEAAAMVKDGSSVMIGGFMANGTPEILMDALVERDAKNLTVICNDGGFGPTFDEAGVETAAPTGCGKLIKNHSVKKLIATHIGLNRQVAEQMNSGELEVELVPQGSMAEKIRAGGAGLGGVLTATGVGTEVAEGKETLVIEGKEYLLEMPLRADFALLRGSIVDKKGNVFYKGTTKNFQQVMATAADTVIVAAEKIVEVGELEPDYIQTPYIFVDYIVGGEK